MSKKTTIVTFTQEQLVAIVKKHLLSIGYSEYDTLIFDLATICGQGYMDQSYQVVNGFKVISHSGVK